MSLASPVKVFATRGSDGLAREVCGHLKCLLPEELQPAGGLSLGKVEVKEFSNDNTIVQIENVEAHSVVVIHTQAPPVDKRLIELFHLLDAIKNARADDVLLVFPYYPYARSDRKDQPRISTFAKTLADILTKTFNIKRVILLDPHDSHIQHYFDPAADVISAIYLLIDYLEREILTPELREKSVIVFSDAGAGRRYGEIPEILGLPEAYIPKKRKDNSETARVKKIIGDVDKKFCIMVDDEICTGGTVIEDTELLIANGASSVCMAAVHAIFAKRGLPDSEIIKMLENSPIERFIVTDTVPVRHKIVGAEKKIVVLPVARLLAEAIRRTVLGQPLTALYDYENVPSYR